MLTLTQAQKEKRPASQPDARRSMAESATRMIIMSLIRLLFASEKLLGFPCYSLQLTRFRYDRCLYHPTLGPVPRSEGYTDANVSELVMGATKRQLSV
jgi:hypothetical protein